MELENIYPKQTFQSQRRSTSKKLLAWQKKANATLITQKARVQSYPLHNVVCHGNIYAVREMLASVTRTVLNSVDSDGMTALHHAAKYGYNDIVLLLLDNGASIDLKTKQGGALQTALRHRREGTASLLLKRGASASLTDTDGMNALHLAVKNRLSIIVKQLLETFMMNINEKDLKLNTALHYAAINDDVDICKAILDHGAEIEAKNCYEETALHLAAGENSKNIVSLLLNFDFTELKSKEKLINMVRNDGKAALLLAAQMGNLEIMKILIDHGADIHSKATDRKSALHLAASCGCEKGVKVLLDQGISIDEQDQNGRTSLHAAILTGNNQVAELLISNNALVSHKDSQGNTPFLLVTKNGNCTLARWLLENGADISDQDVYLKTGLHYAVENGNLELCALFVKQLKTLIHAKDEGGRTPLHYAADLGYFKILELLIERTMQLSDVDNSGETPLHLASRKGHVECVELLTKDLERGSVDICNIDDQTPLHLAVIHNQPSVCLALLLQNANVDPIDRTGWPPLLYAVSHEDLSVLRILLRYNAAVNFSDIWGNTCLMIAAESDKADTVSFLMESGADLECVNRDGDNFFDLAIDFQRESVCKAVIDSERWREALSTKDKNGSHFIEKLIQKYPDIVETILDRSISFSEHHPDDPSFTATFEFQFIEESPASKSFIMDVVDKIVEKRKTLYFAPNIMFKYEREQLLRHPIVSTLMNMKWNRLCRFFYYSRFLLFLVFNISLNIYFIQKLRKVVSGISLSSIIVVSTGLLQMLNEIFKLLVLRHKYFYNLENYVEITLYVLVILTEATDIRPFEVLSILLAWTNHLLYLQGLPWYNVYAVMYIKVCITIVKLLIMFGIIFISFVVAFTLLSIGDDQFKDTKATVLKIFVMMNGEFGIDSWFKEKHLQFPIVTYIAFFLFLLFVAVAFTNLLIGLAVGDIESISSSARLHVFKQKLRLIDSIQVIMPNYILKRYVNVHKYTYHVNRQTNFQRLVKQLTMDTTDADLKHLRMKQADFESNKIENDVSDETTADTTERHIETFGTKTKTQLIHGFTMEQNTVASFA